MAKFPVSIVFFHFKDEKKYNQGNSESSKCQTIFMTIFCTEGDSFLRKVLQLGTLAVGIGTWSAK